MGAMAADYDAFLRITKGLEFEEEIKNRPKPGAIFKPSSEQKKEKINKKENK